MMEWVDSHSEVVLIAGLLFVLFLVAGVYIWVTKGEWNPSYRRTKVRTQWWKSELPKK